MEGVCYSILELNLFFFNSTLVVDILISLSLYAETCVLHETARTGESLIKLHNASMSHPQDCRWQLSMDDFKKKHEKGSCKKFIAEYIADRGKTPFVMALETCRSFLF
jgi:hypothetical protein